MNKFLQFNGRNIYFQSVDGEFYIAIKPICEALDLEYTRQFKNLKEDKILGQLLAEQPMVGADNKIRKMLSLPEKYIYGWIFSINSSSEALQEYKKECYDVLYQHFHGAITGRKELLTMKVKNNNRMAELENKIQESPEFMELQSLKKTANNINKRLKANDTEVMNEIVNLFNY